MYCKHCGNFASYNVFHNGTVYAARHLNYYVNNYSSKTGCPLSYSSLCEDLINGEGVFTSDTNAKLNNNKLYLKHTKNNAQFRKINETIIKQCNKRKHKEITVESL